MFATGFLTAALLGAAQLGVVFGLEALRLDRTFTGVQDEWSQQLTWIAWIVLIAVVGGASFAAGQAQILTQRVGVPVRMVTAFAAGLGAVVTILPLTAYPAVNTRLDVSLDPVLTIAITVCGAAGAGVLLATLIAANPPLTTNVALTTAALWVLAAVTFVFAAPLMGRLYLTPVRLGVLDITQLLTQPRARFSMAAVAFVIGLTAAIIGWMSGRPRALIAMSGTAGPLLVAIAYLISGPGMTREVTSQADAYLGAMIAVLAGLIPSAVIGMLPSRQR